ncbi:MAG: hypothetical protein IJ446_02035 [Oscillospiraceae bacterium]|nr:hypothetical protein [Oscillospiraceae bacterium]
MAKYISLVFRELKLSKKMLISSVGLIILFIAFMMLGMYVSGKDAVENGESMEAFSLILCYMISLLAAGAVSQNTDTAKADIASGWSVYSHALPLTGFDIAVSKCMIKLIFIITGAVLSVIGAVLMTSMGNCTLTLGAAMSYFIILDVFLALNILTEAFTARAKNIGAMKKKGYIIEGIIVAAILIIPELLPEDETLPFNVDEIFSEGGTPAKLNALTEYITIPDVWCYAGIALMFVILAVGFIVTMKNYERRES